MEFRSVFVANPAHLSVRRNQLVIRQDRECTIPMEDISSLMIESRAVDMTAAALQALADNGVTVYFCDSTHMPAALVLPMNRNCRQLSLLKDQIAMTQPAKKRVWQSVVSAKIRNQAICLELLSRPGAEDLYFLSREVRSGDPDNYEAAAAAAYFPRLFGSGFTRGEDCLVNSCLNYGYAILRGAIARNLVTRGLEPCLGIFHHNELNQFNLADDLMEPYRPLVDLFTATFVREEGDLTPKLKQQLFNLSNYVVQQNGKKYKAITAAGRTADSFCRILKGEGTQPELPQLISLQEYRYE